ncbi:MAG: hypothetical protein ABSC19_15065 [Syntrophorhabdales bacterium]|jgi:hypothetical protein
MKKGIAVLVAIMLFTGGCTAFEKSTVRDEGATPKKDAPNVVLYTFPDIPVPKELTLERDKTFIYETPSVKAGVLVLSGNVDLASLENYFRINMTKNGWRFVNRYQYGDTILNFIKDDRASNIRATRSPFTTHVEIWVGPVDRVASTPATSKEDDFK